MGKSYKRTPIVKQERVNKKVWNHAVRQKVKSLDYALKGSQHKRIMLNFHSWKYPWSLQEAIEGYVPNKYFPTLDSYIEYWKRVCLRK